jgi:hypothetical protein
VVPGVEVLEIDGGGHEERFYIPTIKVGDVILTISTGWDAERDEMGNEVFQYKDGRKRAAKLVFLDVKLYIKDQNSTQKRFERYPLSDFGSEYTQIILDFLSVDRSGISPQRVARILFSENEPISPKNYQVVYDD